MQIKPDSAGSTSKRKRARFLPAVTCLVGAVSIAGCSPSAITESPGQTAKETVLSDMQRKVDSLPGVRQISETSSGSDWETFVCAEGEPCLYDNRTYTYTPISATSVKETTLMVAETLTGDYPEVSDGSKPGICENTESCLSKTVKTGEGNVHITVLTVEDPHAKNSFRTTVNLNPVSA